MRVIFHNTDEYQWPQKQTYMYADSPYTRETLTKEESGMNNNSIEETTARMERLLAELTNKENKLEAVREETTAAMGGWKVVDITEQQSSEEFVGPMQPTEEPKKKRKRRTKAEMQAARAKEQLKSVEIAEGCMPGFQKVVGQEKNRRALEVAIARNYPAMLVGKTGTAKTSIIHELAEEHGKYLHILSCTGETSTDEAVGRWLLRDGDTYWVDGIVIRAMRNGDWIVWEEVNAALPEILFVAHSVTDENRSLTLTDKDGEVVKAHPDFRIFATMNPTADYSGTKELNQAFLSRFPIICEFDWLEPAIETQLLSARCGVQEGVATLMVGVAVEARAMQNSGDMFFTFSTRDLLSWGHLMKDMPSNEAYVLSIVNRCPEGDERKLLRSMYTRSIGHLETVAKSKGFPSLDVAVAELEKDFSEVKEYGASIEEMKKKIDEDFAKHKADKSAELATIEEEHNKRMQEQAERVKGMEAALFEKVAARVQTAVEEAKASVR